MAWWEAIMNPSRLRSWIRKYGAAGVLLVGCYLGLHYLWTKRHLATLAVSLAVSLGLGLLIFRPAPVRRPAPPVPIVVCRLAPVIASVQHPRLLDHATREMD